VIANVIAMMASAAAPQWEPQPQHLPISPDVLKPTDQVTQPPIIILLPPPAPWTVPFFDLPPPPTQLPQSIRDLTRAAFEAKDDASMKSILKLARQTNPQATPQIEALEAEYSAQRAEQLAREARARAEKLAEASLLDNWKGEVELGGSRSTGNTDALAIYGALRLEREGLKWQHLVTGRVDFQRSDGETTADRVKFGWQPSYKFSDNLFVYELSQYERDRFLGFGNRFTLSTGIGLTVISNPSTKLTVQGGPAVRYTDYTDRKSKASGAGRASMALRWKVTPTLNFSQDAAVYLEDGDMNAISTTSLETRLLGDLKARLSYDVQYEHSELTDRQPLDTVSRATLVYSF